MRRFLMQLAVVALGLSLTGAVQAGGKNGGSGGSSGSKGFQLSGPSSSYKTFSKPNNTGYSKSDFCYTHRCYCNTYGCDCYWFDSCWYVWYGPCHRYIPYSTYITYVTPVVTVTPAVAFTPV